MMVPGPRLLWLFGLLGVPLAGMVTAWPESAGLSGGLLVGLGLLVLGDALAGWDRGRRGKVSPPEVVRLSRDREGVLPLYLEDFAAGVKSIRLGLLLPTGLRSPLTSQWIFLPEGQPRGRYDWPLTPHRRGRFPLPPCAIRLASPLGLWEAQRILPLEGEIRVYPNLRGEGEELAALFLHRGGLGIHARRQVGKGREFEKVREYVPGDPVDDIHWKATARRGKPVTREYQIERTQEVYVLIDASRLSAREVPPAAPEKGLARPAEGGQTPAPKASPWEGAGSLEGLDAEDTHVTVLERFLTAALVLGLAAEKQGDLFGVLSFSDEVHTFLRARSGKGHQGTCRDALYALQAQPVQPDFEGLCAFVRTRVRRRALLVVLTSLDDAVMAETFSRHVALLAGQHLVQVLMIRPPGAVPLFSQEISDVAEIYQALGGALQEGELKELERALTRRGVQLTQVEQESLCVSAVSRYLEIKRRQLL